MPEVQSTQVPVGEEPHVEVSPPPEQGGSAGGATEPTEHTGSSQAESSVPSLLPSAGSEAYVEVSPPPEQGGSAGGVIASSGSQSTFITNTMNDSPVSWHGSLEKVNPPTTFSATTDMLSERLDGTFFLSNESTSSASKSSDSGSGLFIPFSILVWFASASCCCVLCLSYVVVFCYFCKGRYGKDDCNDDRTTAHQLDIEPEFVVSPTKAMNPFICLDNSLFLGDCDSIDDDKIRCSTSPCFDDVDAVVEGVVVQPVCHDNDDVICF